MRLLLTGCNGQVGFELQRALAPLGDVVAARAFDVLRQRLPDTDVYVLVEAGAAPGGP